MAIIFVDVRCRVPLPCTWLDRIWFQWQATARIWIWLHRFAPYRSLISFYHCMEKISWQSTEKSIDRERIPWSIWQITVYSGGHFSLFPSSSGLDFSKNFWNFVSANFRRMSLLKFACEFLSSIGIYSGIIWIDLGFEKWKQNIKACDPEHAIDRLITTSRAISTAQVSRIHASFKNSSPIGITKFMVFYLLLFW